MAFDSDDSSSGNPEYPAQLDVSTRTYEIRLTLDALYWIAAYATADTAFVPALSRRLEEIERELDTFKLDDSAVLHHALLVCGVTLYRILFSIIPPGKSSPALVVEAILSAA
jgi:hypothetical protein